MTEMGYPHIVACILCSVYLSEMLFNTNVIIMSYAQETQFSKQNTHETNEPIRWRDTSICSRYVPSSADGQGLRCVLICLKAAGSYRLVIVIQDFQFNDKKYYQGYPVNTIRF